MRWQSGVTRRTLLCNTALGTAALAAGGIGAYAQPASKPPNIVFILADDLGYADVSCYGRRDFTTPNIDRIAARGMRFLQGYANSAVCSATRLALITGRYQYRLRARARGAIGGQARGRPAARASDLAVAVEAGGLRHQPDRQVASRRSAEIRSAARAVMITSSVSAAARVDYYSHDNPLQRA